MDTVNIQLNFEEKSQEFPYFSKPECISEFTLKQDRKMTFGRSGAKYLYENCLDESHPNYNLNDGFDSYIKKEEDEKINILLEWIISQTPAKYVDLKKICHDVDFVCFRGLLTKIGNSLYSENDTFRAVAKLYNGVIFLCEYPTEDELEKIANMSEKDKKFTYWGHKFEQYVTCGYKNSLPDTTTPVSAYDEYVGIFKAYLEGVGDNHDKISLIYGAELDCIDPKTGKLIELKTQYDTLNASFWRYKALKWWLQSFLVGINKIVVGYRDNDGIIKNVGVLPVSELTSGSKANFSAKLVMNYILKTLAVIKQAFIDKKDSVIIMEKKKNVKAVELVRINDPKTINIDIFTKEFRERFPRQYY
ncbi:Decapping and exoribonuclease protein [Strongyloides ratti]|uniref:Decapping nuclease n=1 Tax=Strongyloides ratti TaxID=34506 RepID=A0A090LF42_STRRB|nr:Decapping and exoribonuclease protein [Strongyloides ratti]CEF66738.1 Decapping and exoribonuclease protein [Strongyloides ratti]